MFNLISDLFAALTRKILSGTLEEKFHIAVHPCIIRSITIYIYIYIYSSLSTLAGLSYHICGKLEMAFKASPSSQHQHCTDEAQKAETVLSAVRYSSLV